MKTLAPRVIALGGRLSGLASSSSWRASNASANDRGYTYAWQQARIRFLKANPLCVLCEAMDLVEPATVVDHIVPHRGDQVLFWLRSNWRSLCKPHHDSDAQKKDHAATETGVA